MDNSTEQLQGAGLQDIRGSDLVEGLSDLQARNRPRYDVEWGIRVDDGALVFHFFPPGYAANSSANWPNWTDFRDRLENAALGTFDRDAVMGDFVAELKSFYLIIKPLPPSPDLNGLVEQMLAKLELPPP